MNILEGIHRSHSRTRNAGVIATLRTQPLPETKAHEERRGQSKSCTERNKWWSCSTPSTFPEGDALPKGKSKSQKEKVLKAFQSSTLGIEGLSVYKLGESQRSSPKSGRSKEYRNPNGLKVVS